MLMIIKLNVLLIAACAHAAEVATASTFQPWALNDSKAFVFPRIAEKRNRGRRERLAAASRRRRASPTLELRLCCRASTATTSKQTEEASRGTSRKAPAAPGTRKRIWLKTRARSGTGQ